MSRPLIKLCGVTRPADAALAVELGVELVGLNFYPPSPRALTVATARRLAGVISGRALVVGVFVDRPAPEVEEIAAAVGCDLIQLHGDEPPAAVAGYGGRALKVHRVAPAPGERIDPALAAAYPGVWGHLYDLRHERLYGGTGRSWDYRALAGAAPGSRVLVAGGIGPGNARRALAESGAAGVDVCSGVESAPGVKDPVLLERLVRAVRAGDDPAGAAEPHDHPASERADRR